MTRADEIATEFETPFAGRPELRARRSEAQPPSADPAPTDETATAAPGPPAGGTGLETAQGDDATTNGNGHHRGHGYHGGHGKPRVLRVDPEGSVELGEPAPVAGPEAGDPRPARPSVGSTRPSVGSARPSVGSARPSVGSARPSVGSADPEPSGRTDPAATQKPNDEVVQSEHHDTLPEKARSAAGTWLKAAGWTAGTSIRVSNQLVKLATEPGAAQDVIDEVTKEVRDVARDFLGITALDSEVKEMAPLLSSGLLKSGGASPAALRAQGEALLRHAAEVGFDESSHPAFARMLTELSPDEARVLRLLAIEGAQPMVDVRATNLIGNGSQLIAQSLNMLGAKAGLRQRERVPVYLTNLSRLSLVMLSEDPLERPVEYQVLEAQPEVLAHLRDAVRAKTIRRSVHLTPLGEEFCEVCLPVNLPQLPPAADA